MDKTNLINKIKEQIKSLVSTQTEVKFAQIKAGELMISTPDEELKVGSEVMILDEAGVGSPLADGTYTLDEGMIIVVEAGKVKEMMMKPEGEEVEVEAGASYDKEKMAEPGLMMEDKVAKLEEKVAALMEKIDMLMGSTEMMKKELSAIAQSPAGTPIENRNVEFRSVDEKNSLVGSIDLMDIRQRVRKNR